MKAQTTEFAEALKKLCIEHKIYDLDARFNFAIEEHSLTHARALRYSSGDGVVTCLVIEEDRKQI